MWNHILMHLAGFVADKVKEQISDHTSGPSVVASGDRGILHWAAVPRAQATAFKAAYPKAYPALALFNMHKQYKRTNPRAYQDLMPAVLEVADAVESFPQCQVFVAIED